MKILVTGAAGYVGALLAENLAALPEVDEIVATDRRPRSQLSAAAPRGKLQEVTGPLEERDFVRRLEQHAPFDAVIHSAFAVRAAYGKEASAVESANIESCRNVFDLCFQNGVETLVYFSSAAVYGANPENRLQHFFKEDEPLGERTYPYGVQKRWTEELLREMYDERRPETQVFVVRPCSITGPRFLAEPTKKITLIAFLKKMLPVIPEVSPEWSRQYLHETDLVEAIKVLLRTDGNTGFDVYNLAPNDYLTAAEIAQTLGKRTLKVPAWLVNLGFTTLWHATRGRIPTPRGSVRFYQHPINLDGRKITDLGFEYRYGSRECLLTA
jgi:nucleoside-diphosphate-sugar epimerase